MSQIVRYMYVVNSSECAQLARGQCDTRYIPMNYLQTNFRNQIEVFY